MPDYSRYEFIKVEKAERVATVTLNRPDRLNAVNASSIRDLVAGFDRADADDGVRAVIVTGADAAPTLCWSPVMRARNSLEPGAPTVQVNWKVEPGWTIPSSTVCQSPSAPRVCRAITRPDLSGWPVAATVTL